MSEQNLKRDYIWNSIGVLAQTAMSPVLLIVITRINGIEDAGLFSFAFSIALILFSFGIWGGRTYQVSDTKQEFSNRSYITVRLVLAVGMLVAALGFASLNNYDPIKTSIILALVILKISESIADPIYGILQVHGRLFMAGKSLLYKAILGLTVFIIVDIITKNIFLSSMAIIVVNTLVMILYEMRVAKRIERKAFSLDRPGRSLKNAWTIMKRTSPVFAVAFLSMFSLNIPRYFIDKYHGEEIGYFGIIAMPITVIVLLMTFILQPNVVQLSNLYTNRQYAEFNTIVRRLLGATVLVGAVVFVTMVIIGVPVFNFVFGVDFTQYKTALLLMTAGGFINAVVSVFINILTIMRHFKDQFYTLLFTNILLVLLSILMIPTFGMLAGVELFAGANLVQVLVLVAAYHQILKKAQDE